MVCELEGYRWDALLLCETWRHDKEEIWETHHKHIFMGAGKYDNKHGVGILLNKKEVEAKNYWHWIHQRTCHLHPLSWVNRQRIKLMSVYFTHSGYADHHIEKMYRTIEKHTENCTRYIPTIGGDFNAELGGKECKSVGRYTLNEVNIRGDWMKHWMMLQVYTALNTMYRKTPQKQATFISPKGKEKQIDYILTKRKYLRHAYRCRGQRHDPHGKWPQMCHGYFHDHHAWEEHSYQEYKKTRHDWAWWTDQAEKTLKLGGLSSKKYQEIIEKILRKKPPPQTMPQRKQKVKQGKH